MSQYPYEQPPQQYPNPSDPYYGQYQGQRGQGQYPSQQPPTAYGQPEYPEQPYQQQQYPPLQQQAYPPMQQPYLQNQGYQNPYNPNLYAMPTAQSSQGDGLAIAGLVLGIISIVLCWIPLFDLVIGIVGLILSLLGRRSLSRRGLAIAGLVCSIIGLILSLIITVAVLSHSA